MLATDPNLTSRVGNNKKQPYRVLLMGPCIYWDDVGAGLLRREGLYCDIFSKTGWLTYILWAVRGRWRRYDVIYHISGIWSWLLSLILSMTGKPIIWHWIGSDVLYFKSGVPSHGLGGVVNRLTARMPSEIHIADSPEVAEELGGIGIRASVVRLLPERVEADVRPLPPNLSVLSCWSDSRKDLYGGGLVLQLAQEFPNVEFKIAVATKDDEVSLRNVKFLGFQKDMEDIYDHSTVLVRVPEHDSLSAMVLEMLARGRYVIYNKELPGCHFAQNFEEAKKALIEIMKLKEPNISGAQFVKEKFSVAGEAKKLAQICTGLATKPVKPAQAAKVEVIAFTMRLMMCLLLIPAAFLLGLVRFYRFAKNHLLFLQV